MIFKRGKTFGEHGLKPGMVVRCTNSWFFGYKKGGVYTLIRHETGQPVTSSRYNGVGAEWEVINAPLSVEDLL